MDAIPATADPAMTPPARLARRLAFWIYFAAYGIVVLLPLLFGAAALLFAATFRGALFGLGVLAALAFPPCLLHALLTKSRATPAWISGGLAALLLALLLWLAPDGKGAPEKGVHSVFLGPARYGRFSPWNVYPEADQIKLGTRAASLFDPFIDGEQALRLRQALMPAYGEMRAHVNWRRLGSVMNHAYADVLGGSPDSGHLYALTPPGGGPVPALPRGSVQSEASSPVEGRDKLPAVATPPAEGKRPAIVFLHGAGGNFKWYVHSWQPFANRLRAVVVCPSFGFGNWRQNGAVEAVERAREYAVKHWNADPKRTYLIGLSNGGIGALRAAEAHPKHYAGLVLIAPMTDAAIIRSDAFARGWKGRPVLVLYGARDRRVPAAHVEEAVEALKDAGARVKSRRYADEDHFLLLTAHDICLSDIFTWMRVVEEVPGRASRVTRLRNPDSEDPRRETRDP